MIEDVLDLIEKYLIQIQKDGNIHLLEKLIKKMPKDERQNFRALMMALVDRLDKTEYIH